MLRVELDQLQAGMKLALPVRCRHSYKILLNAGTVINEEHVQRLKELNPADVYIFLLILWMTLPRSSTEKQYQAWMIFFRRLFPETR